MKIFDYFEDRMIEAPASSNKDYHSAFTGGWLYHTNKVIKNAVHLFELWNKEGGTEGFTLEEVIFAAMFHDWGKLGDLDNPFYIPQTSEWHRKRGMLYEINKDKMVYWEQVPIRSLFLLQHFGFNLTENEYLGIFMSDGLFEDANKMYFKLLKRNMPILVHHADHMASRCEYTEMIASEKKVVDAFKDALGGK